MPNPYTTLVDLQKDSDAVFDASRAKNAAETLIKKVRSDIRLERNKFEDKNSELIETKLSIKDKYEINLNKLDNAEKAKIFSYNSRLLETSPQNLNNFFAEALHQMNNKIDIGDYKKGINKLSEFKFDTKTSDSELALLQSINKNSKYDNDVKTFGINNDRFNKIKEIGLIITSLADNIKKFSSSLSSVTASQSKLTKVLSNICQQIVARKEGNDQMAFQPIYEQVNALQQRVDQLNSTPKSTIQSNAPVIPDPSPKKRLDTLVTDFTNDLQNVSEAFEKRNYDPDVMSKMINKLEKTSNFLVNNNNLLSKEQKTEVTENLLHLNEIKKHLSKEPSIDVEVSRERSGAISKKMP